MAKFSAKSQYAQSWTLQSSDEEGRQWSVERIQVILLSEIRDELKRLNSLLHCQNFIGIPNELRAMSKDAKRRNRLAEQRAKAKRAATIAARKAGR